jgi:hypothetical protein
VKCVLEEKLNATFGDVVAVFNGQLLQLAKTVKKDGLFKHLIIQSRLAAQKQLLQVATRLQ